MIGKTVGHYQVIDTIGKGGMDRHFYTQGLPVSNSQRTPTSSTRSEQNGWLKQTLKASDATFKLLISPTPMVGPDDGTAPREIVGYLLFTSLFRHGLREIHAAR